MASQFNIECTEKGYTVYRGDEALATFAHASEAVAAVHRYRSEGGETGAGMTSTVPPAIAHMKARLAARQRGTRH